MDLIDKKIIFSLLRDGRSTQRQIASDIGISAQTLNYRLGKLMEDGTIRGFTLHVNPLLYNRIQGFAAFKSEKDYDGNLVMKIRCLEETTLYGFQAETLDGLLRKIEEAGRELGDPVMKYIPLQGTISMNVGKLDYQIIEALKHDPRASASDLASQFDVPYLTVKRRLNLLIRNHLIGVITRVDLTSGDIVLFSIFTDKVDRISPLLGQRLVFAIADERSGVYICFSENLRYAKETIRNVRAVDPEAEVMVLYEYEVFA